MAKKIKKVSTDKDGIYKVDPNKSVLQNILDGMRYADNKEGREAGRKINKKLVEKTRGADGDSAAENIVEFVDPTGITSWDDVSRSYKKSGLGGDTVSEALGAIPVAGKVFKILKKGSKGSKALIPILGSQIKDFHQDVENLVDSFALGGTVAPNRIEHPNTALARNEIAMAGAILEGESNPLVTALNIAGNMAMQYGSSMMASGVGAEGNSATMDMLGGNSDFLTSLLGAGAQFAMGGTVGNVPVEVEGKEVAETPQGQVIDFKGPSHEQGGIDVNLPAGTEVFSDRIRVGGKTMAERKKDRDKRENKLIKRKGDTLSEKTLERVRKANALEEKKDIEIQNAFNAIEQGKKEKKALGGTVGVPPNALSSLLGLMQSGQFDPASIGLQGNNGSGVTNTPLIEYDPNTDSFAEESLEEMVIEAPRKKKPTMSTPPLIPMEVGKPTANINPAGVYTGPAPVETKDVNYPNIGLTSGDLVGMLGNLYQANELSKNTQRERASDTPNINAFADFGKDALDANNQAKNLVQGIADEAIADNRVASTSQKKISRNSARGVNTQRALDLAVHAKEVDANNKVKVNSANQLLALFGQQAQLENQQDQAVMYGEQLRDDNDRKDKGAYFTNMATDIVNKGTAITQVGKGLNIAKERTTTEELLNNQFGDVSYNSNTGKITGKKRDSAPTSSVKRQNVKYLDNTQIKRGDWAKQTNPDTGSAFTSAQEYINFKTRDIEAKRQGSINTEKKVITVDKKKK